MSEEEGSQEAVLLPVTKLVAVAGAALPPLAIAAVSVPVAAIALLLHRKRTKDLKGQYKAAKAKLRELMAERDSALAERDAAMRHVMVLQDLTEEQAEVFAAASREAKELSMKYEEVLLDAGELQARLWRADGFNQELQQTIKRERRERSEREKHISELEKKIQDQKAIINKLQNENQGPFTARSDDSARVVDFNSGMQLVTPPVNEVEKKTGAWPTKLPRPPVPFRDVTFVR